MASPQFVAVGHVTLDRFGEAARPGGAALYAAVTALRLGLRAAIITSYGPDFPRHQLPAELEVAAVPAAHTTVFVHEPGDAGRRLRVAGAARPLGPAHVPPEWREAELLLLAPVLDEVDHTLAGEFPEAAVGAGLQGWLRDLGPGGRVERRRWTPPSGLLERLQALFLSVEEIRGQETELVQWLDRVPLGVVTAGRTGALLYVNGQRYEVAPRPARDVDPTGAGDVFAATFMVRYHFEGDPWQAAAAAACAASLSTEAEGWAAVPDRAGLEAALARYRGAG